MGPGGPPTGPREEKKEGPAEEAPDDKEALRPVEPVPAQPRTRRRLQLFELDGYFRLRSDFFHRPSLGLEEASSQTAPFKFFIPPAQTPEPDYDDPTNEDLLANDANCVVQQDARGVPSDRIARRCQSRRRQGFGSANMRLRLEPTLNVTDTVSVHAQIDVLDNVVLGSTPDSYRLDNPFAPIDTFARTQTPPSAGINGFQDSIVAKRAWGRIRFGFGLELVAGRAPRQWGLGIVYNDGNGVSRGTRDDIVQMVDTDYGDSVDTVQLAFEFGKDRRSTHRLIASYDWAASGRTTEQLLGPEWSSGGTVGQAFSVEKFDNVYQLALGVERRDDPDLLRRKLSLGVPVVNWGVMTWTRWQTIDAAFGTGDLFYDDVDRLGLYSSSLVLRRAAVFTPDLWLRVAWRTLRAELEAAGNIGRLNLRDLGELETSSASAEDFPGFVEDSSSLSAADLSRTRLLNLGYAFEFKYGFLKDTLHIGFDQGFATGDTAAPGDGNNPQAPLGVTDAGFDGTVSAFRFNPAYRRDLLLFRELLGTVSNAAYFNPWAAFYFFDQNFSARLDLGYAFAHRRQSTLGNKFSYGIDLAGALRYHDKEEPIFVQLQYGAFFPLGAFNRLRFDEDGDAIRDDNARAAQTVQAQVGIRF
jgi:uncharacterized protein (TIGR04551 family)